MTAWAGSREANGGGRFPGQTLHAAPGRVSYRLSTGTRSPVAAEGDVLMRRSGPLCLFLVFLVLCTSARTDDGNRLAHLDEGCDPYYVGLHTAKLVTPQWVGEEGVEAVIVLSTDDLREVDKHEQFLRPILQRLKKIGGRAPLSLMANRVDADHPHLQKWLGEGLSLEAHTYDHPCPLLQGGDLASAKETYDRAVDLVAAVPNHRPVAFRMPCCDSMSSLSPRFFSQIFNRLTPGGNFLSVDSSVFLLFTADDPQLPRGLVLDADGREKFRKYVPTDRVMANYVEDYPYPYVIGRLCWELPTLMPSDWDAQHRNGVCSPLTVRDLKAAVDAAVVKQGVFSLCFHPHGWIRNDQLIELIDHALARHGKKVKFLTFRDVCQRLTENVLGGHPLRAADGRDNGVRVLDVNGDGYMDAVMGNEKVRQTRLWSPRSGGWTACDFPVKIVDSDGHGPRHEAGVRFGILGPGGASLLVRNEETAGLWTFDGTAWVRRSSGLEGLELDGPVVTGHAGRDRGVRLRDLDGDGVCELIVGNEKQRAAFGWLPEQATWRRLPFGLPPGTAVVDARGRAAGLRLIDLDEDGRLDVVFSDAQRCCVRLFLSLQEGWSREILCARRGDADALPSLVRADGTDNGAWFKHRHLWVQNEETGSKLPGHVFSRHYTQILDVDHEPPARSPAGSLRAMLPRPGFRVELMAAEPLVMDPIDIAWGPDGKAWVVEMADYPLGMSPDGHLGLPDPPNIPGGRIRFLEDTDGDGNYDKSTVFLKRVGYPSGVVPWRKGVLVTAAPEIFYAEDTDGDGRADVRETLFHGFEEGNQQHRVNHPRWGLDNWVHAANGDSNGVVRSAKTGKAVDISGRDVRFRPDAGVLQTQTGRTQFGLNRDDWGNWFGCNNNNPGWHFVLADHYLRRNPYLAAPPGRRDLTASRDAWPGGRVVTHCFYDQPTPPEGLPGRWTSIGGVMIYRDELFGPEYCGNLFVGDSVYCVIHRMIVEGEGVTFRGERAPDEQQSEFLACSDPWFRPATVRTGPDGALWVVDMYRFVIEHPEWIDDRLEKTLDLRKGHRLGRIYRIYPVHRRPRPIPRLDRLDTAGLVAALDSPSGWQRDMAQQMLLWRADRSAEEPLQRMARRAGRAQARLHALCTLDGLGALGPQILERALADPHPGVRRHAVRLSESLLDSHPALGEALLERLDDPDPQVRMQLAYSLGEWDDARAGRALGRMAAEAVHDPYLTAAVMSSAPGHLKEMIAQVEADRGKAADRGLLLHKLLKLLDRVQADPGAAAEKFEPLRVRAEKLLDDPERRRRIQQALRKLQPVTDTTGDPMRGKSLFVEATCSVCHRLEDLGEQIGPDLKTLIDRSPQNLLVAVIDPSRAFLERFAEYIAVTVDGLQHGGMLLDETSNSILLVDVDGNRHVILRKDIEELVNTGRSHMPEGLEGKLDLQEMADLFAFVGQTESTRRQFPGNEPRPVRPDDDGSLWLSATTAEIYGKQIAFEPKYRNIGLWYGQEAYVSWPIRLARGGQYEVWLQWASADQAAGNRFLVQVGNQKLSGKVPGTGSWDNYCRARFGRLRLEPGDQRLGLRSDGPISGALIDLRAIRLIPAAAGRTSPSKTPGGGRPPTLRPLPDGSLRLEATAACGLGPRVKYLPDDRAFGWLTAADRLEWRVDVPKAGFYDAWLEWACSEQSAGKPFDFRIGEARLIGAAASTGSWQTFRRTKIGRMELPPGKQTAVLSPGDRFEGLLLDLREIHLVPVGRQQ